MKRLLTAIIIIFALTACQAQQEPEMITISVGENSFVNGEYIRGIIASGAPDGSGFSQLPEKTLESIAEFLDTSKQEIGPGIYEIDPAWLFQYGDFFIAGEGMSAGPEASFNYLTAGLISPDGSTLICERYDGKEGVKGKWDGYYIDVISLDGEFESYSISSASPYIECWLSDRYFVCHVGKGMVYVYDLKEAKETQIGPLFSDLKAAESGSLILNPYYGEDEDHIINYSFAEDGSIIIDDPDWDGVWGEAAVTEIDGD